MDIIEIIKTYGKNDYYEMQTGRIFALSKMVFDGQCTIIPVYEDGEFVGTMSLKGDYTK